MAYYTAKENIKEIRKQVCDEIRKLAHTDFEFVVCDECYNTIDKDVYLSSKDLTKISTQIEQWKWEMKYKNRLTNEILYANMKKVWKTYLPLNEWYLLTKDTIS